MIQILFFIPLEKAKRILYYSVVNNKNKNYIFNFGDDVNDKIYYYTAKRNVGKEAVTQFRRNTRSGI